MPGKFLCLLEPGALGRAFRSDRCGRLGFEVSFVCLHSHDPQGSRFRGGSCLQGFTSGLQRELGPRAIATGAALKGAAVRKEQSQGYLYL